MYSAAVDQPLYCVDAASGRCVLCESCETSRNDPGNVRTYCTAEDYRMSANMAIGIKNGGGGLDKQTAPAPKCACE
jgi:hypothetical protein